MFFLVIVYKYWFINGNKCIALRKYVNNRKNRVDKEKEYAMYPAQLCKPKTAIKNKVY